MDKKVFCNYCNIEACLVTGDIIYPNRPDLKDKYFWYCNNCNAYVGTHTNSKRHAPLGRLANKELRLWKNNAHALFDPIWKSGQMSRIEAYEWLACQLGIDVKKCHIGYFDVDTCKKVVEICKKRS